MSNLTNTEFELNDALQRAKQLATSIPTTTSLASPTNGQKRSHQEDEDNYDLNSIPAKRSNNNGMAAMAGMGMGGPIGGDPLVETIEVPDSAVGLVIGRGGEQISQIQQQSGCRVQMAGESMGTGMRQCTLQGPKHCIDKARQLIEEVITRSRQPGGMGGGGGLSQNGGGGGGNYVTQELLIPGPKCGLIIGKNGETIKSLQEQIGVKMLLIQDSQQVSVGPKPLRITGFADKVEQAKRAVESLLNSEGGVGGGGGIKSVGEVIVPRSSVGIIIGKAGETIKRLAMESGAKIQFKPDDDPNIPERCAVIQGTPDQINRATQLISELVQRSATGGMGGGGGGGGNQEVFYMHVPANKTGLVIGKGGDTIKQVCGESGAHVELSRDPPPNPQEKVFVIKGTPFQIHQAQHLIRIKVGDVPPGTPAPPFPGGGGSSAISASTPYGVGQSQFGSGGGGAGDHFGTAQWANGFVGGQDASAWAQYYNQQQQASYATAAAQPGGGYGGAGGGAGGQGHYQQQQQPAQQSQQQQGAGGAGGGGGAPAINPQTGQPDYSAQWAEYYRSLGMHDQANLIEQQMKGQQGGGGGGAAATGGAGAAARPQQQQQQQVYYSH